MILELSAVAYSQECVVEKYPNHEFSLIIGTDNLETFHKWRNYEWTLAHHHIYWYPRRESDGGDLKEHHANCLNRHSQCYKRWQECKPYASRIKCRRLWMRSFFIGRLRRVLGAAATAVSSNKQSETATKSKNSPAFDQTHCFNLKNVNL